MDTKRLTVLQIVPALHSGGVERGILEMGAYLASQGHRSIVISKGGRMERQLVDEGSEHIRAAIGAKTPFSLRYIPWLRRFLLDLNPDIVHVQSRFPAWITYFVWKSLPLTRRPRLITSMQGLHSVSWYSRIMTSGERVIAVSESIKKHIRDNYPDTDMGKILVIPCGVDRMEYYHGYAPTKEWQENWYSQFPQTKDKLLVALPGRMTRRKGASDFIRVMKQIKDAGLNVHGLIVGETHARYSRYTSELEELVKSSGLENDITFVGHRNDLRDVMAICQVVFLLSTLPEAFPRVSLEALSLGIPVVGYGHGGLEEQLEKLFPFGSVALNDVDSAAARAIAILTKNSVPAVEQNVYFSLQQTQERTLSLYCALTEEAVP